MTIYYKQKIDFAEENSYYLFLKRCSHLLTPKYFSIISKSEISTQDGIMYQIKLSAQLEDPNLGIIAQLKINNIIVYYLNDKYYAEAINNEQQWSQTSDYELNPIVIYEICKDDGVFPAY